MGTEAGTIQLNADGTGFPSGVQSGIAFNIPPVRDESIVELIAPLPGANPGRPDLPTYGAGPLIPSTPAPPSGSGPSIPVFGTGGGAGAGPRTTPRKPRARSYSDVMPGPTPGTARVRMAGGEWRTVSVGDLNPTDRAKLARATSSSPVLQPKPAPRKLPTITRVGASVARAAPWIMTGVLVAEEAYDLYREYQKRKAAEEREQKRAERKRRGPDEGRDLELSRIYREAIRPKAVPATPGSPPVNVNVTVMQPEPPRESRERKPLAVKLPTVKVAKAEPLMLPLPQLPQSVPEKVAKAVGKVAASPTVRTLLSLSSLASLVPRSTQLRIGQARTNVDPITTNNLLQLQQGQPLPGSFGGGSSSSSSSRCRCTKPKKRQRSSCRNPVVSKRSRTVDGRILQTTTREITCPQSRPKRA